MTRKLIILLVTAALGFSLVSCNSKSNTTNDDKDNKPAVEQTDDPSDKDKNDKDENDNSSDKSNSTDENKNNTASSDNKNNLSLYSIDENTLEPNKASDVSVSDSSSLQDKVQKLSNEISKNYFEGLPITVQSIDTVDGKKIATINLTDGSDGSTWANKFQGSVGGQITANTLIENFLQISYKGEWIDGVKFLYNNAPIEYDHVYELSQIQYRN